MLRRRSIPNRLLALLGVGLLAIAAARTEEISAPRLMEDLELSVHHADGETILVGSSPRVEVRLTNRSKDATYPVVAGSVEDPRSEPTVFIEVEVQEDDNWVIAPKRRVLGCGTYMSDDWRQRVTSLKPTETTTWTLSTGPTILPGSGRIRIRAYYEYRSGPGSPTREVGVMKGVPAFKLVSKPLYLQMKELVRLHVRTNIDELKMGTRYSLDQFCELEFENMTDLPVHLGLQPSFVVTSGRGDGVRLNHNPRTRFWGAVLRAGKKKPLTELFDAADLSALVLDPVRPGTHTLYLQWTTSDFHRRGPVLLSRALTLRVVP